MCVCIVNVLCRHCECPVCELVDIVRWVCIVNVVNVLCRCCACEVSGLCIVMCGGCGHCECPVSTLCMSCMELVDIVR